MKQLLVATVFTLLVNFSFSQLLKEAIPESAGVSSERLKRIDKILQEYVDKKWIAGGMFSLPAMVKTPALGLLQTIRDILI